MSVKVGRLWRKGEFKLLSQPAKLLYIYLATNPDLNTVGVFSPDLEVARIEVGMDEDTFQEACREVVKSRLVHAKKFGDVLYFIVPAHFDTIPKAESSIARIQKTLSDLPEGLIKFLAARGIDVDAKVKNFEKPTPSEVSKYAASKGYNVDGNEFCNFYEEQAERFGKKGIWVDSRGKQVRDWKAKCRKIWFKPENKITIKVIKGAPKGFENLSVEVDGRVFGPDGWKKGKPWSSILVVDIALKKEYERLKGSS